ncbi:MAG: hypothetical protein ACLGHO_11765 [Gammaproteobacteria bacterium]
MAADDRVHEIRAHRWCARPSSAGYDQFEEAKHYQQPDQENNQHRPSKYFGHATSPCIQALVRFWKDRARIREFHEVSKATQPRD